MKNLNLTGDAAVRVIASANLIQAAGEYLDLLEAQLTELWQAHGSINPEREKQITESRKRVIAARDLYHEN